MTRLHFYKFAMEMIIVSTAVVATATAAQTNLSDKSPDELLKAIHEAVEEDGFQDNVDELLAALPPEKRLIAVEALAGSEELKERFTAFFALRDLHHRGEVKDDKARRLAMKMLPQHRNTEESIFKFAGKLGSEKARRELEKKLNNAKTFERRWRLLSDLVAAKKYEGLEDLSAELNREGLSADQRLRILSSTGRYFRDGTLEQMRKLRDVLRPFLADERLAQREVLDGPAKKTVAYEVARIIQRHLPGFRASLPRELGRGYEVAEKQSRVFEYVKRLRAWLKKFGEDPIRGWRAQLAKKMRTISQAPATYRALRDPVVELGFLLDVSLGMPNYQLEANMTPNRVKLLQKEVTAWYEKWKGKPYAEMRKAAAKAHERISKAVLDLKPIEPPEPRKLTEEEKERQRWERLKKESKKYQAEHERKRQELLRRKREQMKKDQENQDSTK